MPELEEAKQVVNQEERFATFDSRIGSGEIDSLVPYIVDSKEVQLVLHHNLLAFMEQAFS
jgi:hypothetical protein